MRSLSSRALRQTARRSRRTFATELLESRHLLAGLVLTADKSPIDSVLTGLADSIGVPVGQGPIDKAALVAAAKAAGVQVSSFGDLGVTITAVDTVAIAPGLHERGLDMIANLPDKHWIEGYLPVTALQSMLELRDAGLLGVRASYTPITHVGAVADQADVVHETDRVRAALPTGYDGKGLTIGVLSDSYDSLGGAAADIASGDLPAIVELVEDAGTTDEGRAMLQLVHDLAPGAELAFATAFTGQQGFADNIEALAALGCDVIVDDVSYFAEPMFQDGIITQAVDNVVTNSGVAYFSSAGNSADQSYESSNISFATDALGTPNCYDFNPGAGVDTRQSITLSNGESILLSFQWDDPFYTVNGVDTDLDIYLVRAGTNTVVASGATDNFADQSPVEVFGFTNNTGSTGTTDFEIIINKFGGPNPQRLKYVDFRGDMTVNEFDTNSSTVFGHSASANGIAVAAAGYFRHTDPESFTSHGTTSILFAPNGTRLSTAQVRNTPQITAIDGTNTTFFGNDAEGDGRPNFFGTSAAAPHAAAIAALIKQANPGFNPQQIYQRMQDTAIDLATPGWDKITGFGLVNAYDAIFGPAQAAQVPFSEDFETGVLSQAWETNTENTGRISVSDLNAPFAGTRHLALDTFFGLDLSLNEAILHLNLLNVADVTLEFQEKESTDSDDPMPATFTGSVNADGVALSVDGVNWFRLADLTSTNSLDTYTAFNFDLIDFATTHGITLGTDVRIKFQQYDNSNAPNRGIFFDNIIVNGTSFNTPPIAVDDPLPDTLEDIALNIPGGDLTANDMDAELDALTVTAVGNAVNGTVSLSGGIVTFVPDPEYSGSASFEYTVTDGIATDVGLVTFTLLPVNDPPIAVDDPLTGATENIPFVVNASLLTANDTDAENDLLSVTAVGNATHGTVSLNAGVVTYTSVSGYDGPASFEYTVSDGFGTDIGLVTFTISGINDAPRGNSSNLVTDEDTFKNGVLTGSDPEGDALTFVIIGNPSHGLITFFNSNTGAFTYVPAANYNGPDSIAFRASDGSLQSANAKISITVNPINDAPVLIPTSPSLGSIAQGTTDPAGRRIDDMLAGNVTDADGSLARGIAISFASATAHGSWQFKYDALNWTSFPPVSKLAAFLLPGRAQVRYVPNLASFSGEVRITYRAWDQTQGVVGGAFDLTSSTNVGGSTAFSANYDAATLKIDKPPELTQANTAPRTYSLNGTPGVDFMRDASGNAMLLNDPDSADFDGGVLRVRTTAGKKVGDRIVASWNFSYLGTNVLFKGVHIGDVLSNGFDGNDLAIRFNTKATGDTVRILINSLKFLTIAGEVGTRTLQVNVGDGDGGTSNTLTRKVVVT